MSYLDTTHLEKKKQTNKVNNLIDTPIRVNLNKYRTKCY